MCYCDNPELIGRQFQEKNYFYYYFVFTFMQFIYNYIPETNLVTRIYIFAAILYLQFMVHVMLFPVFNVLYFYIYNGHPAIGLSRPKGFRVG